MDETDLVKRVNLKRIEYPYECAGGNLVFTNRLEVTAEATRYVARNFDERPERRTDKYKMIIGSHVSFWWSS